MANYSVSSFITLMNTPTDFLRSISNMLQDEKRYGAELTSLMRSHVLALALASVHSPVEAVRDEALWMAANLLGADDPALREFTIQRVNEQNIATVAARSYRNDSGLTAKSAAYFLFNWAKQIDTIPDAKRLVMDLLSIALVRRKGACDLLWAAIHVAKRFPETIPVHMLTTALRNEHMKPKRRALVWRLIGTAAEEKGLVDGSIDTLMLRLENQLPHETNVALKKEMLWILSNLLNEERGVGIFHYKYYKLRKEVEKIVWTCHNRTGILHEALMVLANYAVLAKETEICNYLALDESLRILFRTFKKSGPTERIQQIAREGLAALESYAPVDVVVDIVDDDDATVSEIEPCNSEDECCAFRIDTRSSHFCPSAYDLLAGDYRGRESKAVRDLVELIENKPAGTWASVPPDYTLTIADLINIQHMGYVIQNGRFGINPALYSE
jgi:hypothetical protein